MKKNVLLCASTSIHIQNFHLPYIDGLIREGFSVDTMCQGELSISGVTTHHNLHFDKKGRFISLMKTCLTVSKLLKQNRYELISVHTTLAAGICRLALLLAGKRDTVLIYTCHGYLYSMCRGFKKKLGILCEKILSVTTDAVVTMNRSDYEEAKQYHYASRVFFVHGMGVDPNKLEARKTEDLRRLRDSLEIEQDNKIFLCVGEFSPRKNQAMLLRAMAEVVKQRQQVCLILAGDGELLEDCKCLCEKLGIDDKVIFTGHCSDVPALMQLCDYVVSASLCEGLPFNVMEGLYFGKSIAASSVRGHIDLLDSKSGAVLFNPNNWIEISQSILNLMEDRCATYPVLPPEYLINSCIDEYSQIYSYYITGGVHLGRREMVSL